MTTSEIKTNISNVLRTLNLIEVSGRENLNRMLGCIILMENLEVEVAKLEEPQIVNVDLEAHDAEHPAE